MKLVALCFGDVGEMSVPLLDPLALSDKWLALFPGVREGNIVLAIVQ